MSNFEKKFGKYAIPNLTLVLIIGYLVGFLVQISDRFTGNNLLAMLTLDPWKILHGQVWRLFTWLIIPPSNYASLSGILFLVLMMWCCLSIGMSLERTWGTYKYNVYIFGGILFTIIASFASLGLIYVFRTYLGIGSVQNFADLLNTDFMPWNVFSTYYINMSIYIGFALTYPNNYVRFMFFIPMKMKWLGIIDLLYFGYDLFNGLLFIFSKNGSLVIYGIISSLSVIAALLNILIFWLINLRRGSFSIKQYRRRKKFEQDYVRGQTDFAKMKATAKHKCCVCDITDKDNPSIDFRYCSKCNGNYEYCQTHLFTHTHKG